MSGILSSSVSTRFSISISLFNRYIPNYGVFVVHLWKDDGKNTIFVFSCHTVHIHRWRNFDYPAKPPEMAFQTNEVHLFASWLLSFNPFGNKHIAADTEGD